MVELSKKRIEQILHEETANTEEPAIILRSIYTRYMYLYEKYFADIDSLDNKVIAELREYHEETKSLVKYYYMDIPEDVIDDLEEFEEKYSDNMLGARWREHLFDAYQEFQEDNEYKYVSEEEMKAEFTRQALKEFYNGMDYVFRDGFGTGSQTGKEEMDELTGMLFGQEEAKGGHKPCR